MTAPGGIAQRLSCWDCRSHLAPSVRDPSPSMAEGQSTARAPPVCPVVCVSCSEWCSLSVGTPVQSSCLGPGGAAAALGSESVFNVPWSSQSWHRSAPGLLLPHTSPARLFCARHPVGERRHHPYRPAWPAPGSCACFDKPLLADPCLPPPFLPVHAQRASCRCSFHSESVVMFCEPLVDSHTSSGLASSPGLLGETLPVWREASLRPQRKAHSRLILSFLFAHSDARGAL